MLQNAVAAIWGILEASAAFYTPAPCMDTTHAHVLPVAAPVACGGADLRRLCGAWEAVRISIDCNSLSLGYLAQHAHDLIYHTRCHAQRLAREGYAIIKVITYDKYIIPYT